MEILDHFVVFVIGTIAGSFGTLIGGGAFIVIPALIFLGLPPQVAIGTNKLGALGMFSGGWYAFNKKGAIDYKMSLIMVVPALPGVIIGSVLVFQFNEAVLKQIIAVLTIIILLLVFFQPDVGINNAKPKITLKTHLLGAIFFFFIYIYMGFYGAGAGTFLIYVLILFFGQTFIESAATTKIASLSAMIISAVIFAMNGAMHYPLGISLFAGCFIGDYFNVTLTGTGCYSYFSWQSRDDNFGNNTPV